MVVEARRCAEVTESRTPISVKSFLSNVKAYLSLSNTSDLVQVCTFISVLSRARTRTHNVSVEWNMFCICETLYIKMYQV